MAVIGITLNEVIRDFLNQLIYTYDKYISESDVVAEDIVSLDLSKYFPMEKDGGIDRFIHDECCLEIFGHADQLKNNILIHFNNFIMDIEDDT